MEACNRSLISAQHRNLASRLIPNQSHAVVRTIQSVFCFVLFVWTALSAPSRPLSTADVLPAAALPVRGDGVYLNPAMGRFWTMDSYEGNSSDPLSLHKYLYCHADPVNGTDPSGHDLTSTLTTMSIGFGIGAGGTAVANHALGRAQTFSSIFIGGAFGAALGPLAVAIPEIGVGLGIYGIGASGSITYEVFSNPSATASQKAAAVSLVVASIWGTQVAIKHYNGTRLSAPAGNATAPGVPEFPLPLRAPPEVVLESAQPGLDAGKIGQLPGLIESMAAGKQIPGIGGWKIGNRYIVNEGNHRMTAALELYKASGDPKHILQLLKEGNWTNRDPGVPTWKMTQD